MTATWFLSCKSRYAPMKYKICMHEKISLHSSERRSLCPSALSCLLEKVFWPRLRSSLKVFVEKVCIKDNYKQIAFIFRCHVDNR